MNPSLVTVITVNNILTYRFNFKPVCLSIPSEENDDFALVFYPTVTWIRFRNIKPRTGMIEN